MPRHLWPGISSFAVGPVRDLFGWKKTWRSESLEVPHSTGVSSYTKNRWNYISNQMIKFRHCFLQSSNQLFEKKWHLLKFEITVLKTECLIAFDATREVKARAECRGACESICRAGCDTGCVTDQSCSSPSVNADACYSVFFQANALHCAAF